MLSTQDKDVQTTIEAALGADTYKIVANEPIYHCQKLSLLQANLLFPKGKLETQSLNEVDCLVYTAGDINFLISYDSDWEVSKNYQVKMINLNNEHITDRRTTSFKPTPVTTPVLPGPAQKESDVQKAIREATTRTSDKNFSQSSIGEKKWLTPVDMFHYAVSYMDSTKYVKDMDSAHAITTDFESVRKKFMAWLASDFSSSGISEILQRLAHVTLSDIIVSDYDLTELVDDPYFSKLIVHQKMKKNEYARFLCILYIICCHKQVGTDYSKTKLTFEKEYIFLNNYRDSIKYRMSYLINNIIPFLDGEKRIDVFMSLLLMFIYDDTDTATIALLLVDLESKYSLDTKLRSAVAGAYRAIKMLLEVELVQDQDLGSLGIYEDIFVYVKDATPSDTYTAFDAIKDGLNVIKEPVVQEKEVWNLIAGHSNTLTVQSHPFLWGLTYGIGKDIFKHKEQTLYAQPN